MKSKLISLMMLVLLMLISCTSEDNNPNPNPNPDVDIAYISIKIDSKVKTRASGEDPGDADESVIKSLYIMTFDDAGNIVGIPGTGDYYTLATPANTNKPNAIKMSTKGKNLLVVANPGTELLKAISGLGPNSTFTSFNRAISGITMSELTDTSPFNKGFAMISCGDDSGLSAGQKITSPLKDISGHIKEVKDYPNEAAAIQDAENNTADINIERISAKLQLKVKTPVDAPTGAKFDFQNWTLDAVNSTTFPFAEKTILSVVHNPGGEYVSNFYTQDPNFTGNIGIDYTTLNNYVPSLVTPYTWMSGGAITYCIENTMAAAEQKFQNATRLVIKGTYYPDNSWTGDWFSFAGINYKTLANLQTAYEVVGATNLQNACDDMFNKISAYALANTISLDGTDFKSLTTADLQKITPGGEVIKTAQNTPCIRWYKEGLNYYYYEIDHDYTAGVMEFGKYGVVRNNWYSLTLANVKGAGSPWYPDIQNPGPGDPDPTDPIDESVGYLGIEVEVTPWIIWEREIEI